VRFLDVRENEAEAEPGWKRVVRGWEGIEGLRVPHVRLAEWRSGAGRREIGDILANRLSSAEIEHFSLKIGGNWNFEGVWKVSSCTFLIVMLQMVDDALHYVSEVGICFR
jgi:hypothetical protein